MSEHRFGGDWTEIKLAKLEKYLRAYRTIFSGNPRARHFRTWYVDAFAGTGSRTRTDTPRVSPSALFGSDVYEDVDTKRYRDGSAKIAVALPDPFDNYLFIDKSAGRIKELERAIETERPALHPRCAFEHGDANDVLKQWCRERDWTKERAVVFLDPYGMQVEWGMVATLGATKAVDLWYLFPLGVGVARLLTRDGNIDESWAKRLDTTFGTKDWRSRFYETTQQEGLFGQMETVERDASEENIQGFINERLRTCFAGVAKGRILRNSKSNPMYSLCFAAANEKGAPTAIRIAKDILSD
ncbi:MAG: three-Cys-motif partner protein TcmP [Acidobacteriia bacterium]|nr:three-Cys-motif partner protein TcmP [Terriglobia bacterium]